MIHQFNQFIEAIDDRILDYINLNDNELTRHIFGMQVELGNNYREINGTSAGFHGISEYIVFSACKNFIENLNKPKKFNPIKINRDLRFFELEKNDKTLSIYRSASMRHFADEAKGQLFRDNTKFRAPDIAILKKEGNIYKLVAVVEIKGYLDKGSADSAIEMLSQIREMSKDQYTKYALFSFSRISVGNEETIEHLKTFKNCESNFLVTVEKKNEDAADFAVIDLSQFFDSIKEIITL
jgi:hypothetical protein